MSSSPVDYNAKVIDEFRAGGGKVGGSLKGMPLLLLHHKGARSGSAYVTPLAYLRDGDRYVIFGSAAGSPKHPGWFHNVKADPHVTIEVGTEQIDLLATVVEGQERDRLFEAQVQKVPQFAGYAQKTDRVIPVVTLSPASA